MLHDASSLADMAAERYNQKRGLLRIATTHVHARYALLKVIRDFTPAYPEVDIELKQQDPKTIVDLVAAGECHIGVGTLPASIPKGVVTLPAYPIERCIITPLKHPLLRLKRPRLEDVAKYPLIAYDRVFVAGRLVHKQFETQGLLPRIALKATDADVIKAAVGAGLGISVFQRMAVEPLKDKELAVVEARHLFPDATAYISLRRGEYLRAFVYDFIARLAPQWGRKEIEQKLKG
jgi:LysR family cys regulon transcriptional activator